jgi:hypothetical protein
LGRDEVSPRSELPQTGQGQIDLVLTRDDKAFLNHESAIASIAKALARIADALPRIELATTLYQTTRMTAAVEGLYAHIIQFLIRAYDWYREGTFRHIFHSITRPVELRYHDLLEHIETGSRNIEQLAVAGSQVELRQMHTTLKLMADRVEKTESVMIELKYMITSKLMVPRSQHLHLLRTLRPPIHQLNLTCGYKPKGFGSAILGDGLHCSSAFVIRSSGDI